MTHKGRVKQSDEQSKLASKWVLELILFAVPVACGFDSDRQERNAIVRS